MNTKSSNMFYGYYSNDHRMINFQVLCLFLLKVWNSINVKLSKWYWENDWTSRFCFQNFVFLLDVLPSLIVSSVFSFISALVFLLSPFSLYMFDYLLKSKRGREEKNKSGNWQVLIKKGNHLTFYILLFHGIIINNNK